MQCSSDTAQRSAQRPAHRPPQQVGRSHSSVSSRTAENVRGVDTDIVRALMFAQGLDERGGRLPLASDSMSDEERRPHHIVAERQGSVHRPTEFAEIYRMAESFEDGLPNVSAVRPLTHKVRLATSDQESITSAGAPLFTPREAPSHLRALPQRRELPTVDRRTALAPTASFSTPRSPRLTQPSAGNAARASRSRTLSTTVQPGNTTSASVAVGALAFAQPVAASAQRDIAKPLRPALHAVSSAPKKIASYGVVAFWVMFVMAFLFVAVVMHAGIAHRQMTLDEINVQLEQSEYSNAQLRVEVASLQSPTRIADAAARLGLSSPTGIRFVQAIPASVAPVAAAQVSGTVNSTEISGGVVAGQTGG